MLYCWIHMNAESASWARFLSIRNDPWTKTSKWRCVRDMLTFFFWYLKALGVDHEFWDFERLFTMWVAIRMASSQCSSVNSLYMSYTRAIVRFDRFLRLMCRSDESCSESGVTPSSKRALHGSLESTTIADLLLIEFATRKVVPHPRKLLKARLCILLIPQRSDIVIACELYNNRREVQRTVKSQSTNRSINVSMNDLEWSTTVSLSECCLMFVIPSTLDMMSFEIFRSQSDCFLSSTSCWLLGWPARICTARSCFV